MRELTWLIPLLPLTSAVLLMATAQFIPRKLVPVLGVGSVGLAALCVLALVMNWEEPYQQILWEWMDVVTADFNFYLEFGFYVDELTLVMLSVITGVGFLIHLYSAEFMADDPSIARYFAYLNLFVAAMLILVLADNLLLLYLGWEGVGVCSYLLVGFWYQEPANGTAARKAFIVTRVGDAAMLLGLFLLFAEMGTLEFQIMEQHIYDHLYDPDPWWQPVGGDWNIALATALLLAGAVGKSAQLPLHTWLPDAMAGPTPVSALIHAATMVTAGVYLVARTHHVFLMAPAVLMAVAVVGLLTLLLAAFAALNQRDIKRILAYSTISQIGYMFLGLGVGAWSAAIFHLMTHAFFKALLFLGAGAVIHCLHHEHDIFRMGGLRTRLPVAFWSFLIGSAALAALPFTSGFFSKDLIVLAAYDAPVLGPWLWGGALLGAFLTALYSFRLVFVAFFGEVGTEPDRKPGWRMHLPLVVLCGLSLAGGWIALPLAEVLPADGDGHPAAHIEYISIGVPMLGLLLAYGLFLGRQLRVDSLVQSAPGQWLHRFWHNGWQLDRLYDLLWVRPYQNLTARLRGEPVDRFYHGVMDVTVWLHQRASDTQTGRLRWYATVIVGGLILLLGIMAGMGA